MKQIKTFDEFYQLQPGIKLRYCYPKSLHPKDCEWQEAVFDFDEKAVNKAGLKYKDIDDQFQRQGIWEGQLEKGNVLVEIY